MQAMASQARADVSLNLSINNQLQWSLLLMSKQLDPVSCTLLSCVSPTLTSASTVCSLLRMLNATKSCLGNPDKKFFDHWHQRSLTLHGSSGNSKCHAVSTLILYIMLHVHTFMCHKLIIYILYAGSRWAFILTKSLNYQAQRLSTPAFRWESRCSLPRMCIVQFNLDSSNYKSTKAE